MVDGFIGHMLFCLCNRVIAAECLFARAWFRSPEISLGSKGQANSAGGMRGEIGGKSFSFIFTLLLVMSCFVLIKLNN